MFNLSNKIIRSVYLDIECFDDAMDPISVKIDFAFQALQALPQEDFGDRQAIELDSLKIANVKIILSKVVFGDDTVWRNEEKKVGIELPAQKPILPSDGLYAQIRREFGNNTSKCRFWYEDNVEYWRCSCGQPNSDINLKCDYCGNTKEWLEKHFNQDYLLLASEKYQEEQQKAEMLRMQKEAEEKQRREQERIHREELEKRTKKQKKLRISIASILCVAFVAVIYCNTAFSEQDSKKGTYNLAMERFNENKYSEAINYFDEVIDYKDSEIMIIECRYQIAMSYFNKEQYYAAMPLFKLTSGYKDSDEKLEIAKTHAQ